MSESTDTLTRQMLGWIAERPRTYVETMDAWRTSCPRLAIWEDAQQAGLVQVTKGHVKLTQAGRAMIDPAEADQP